MKLELKKEEIIPYLPFKLKAAIRLREDSSLPVEDDCVVTITCFEVAYLDSEYDEFKPILRPLSDLTKQRIDIIYFGVIATDNDMYGTRDEFEDDLEIWLCDMAHIPLCVYNFLIMNHFDVFRLIEKGLAIDINTL